MKKILEVLQFGDGDIRFSTDFHAENNPDSITDIMTGAAAAMTTTLWGGNEASVMAVIRALCVADLACSINRKEMIDFLDQMSEDLQESMAQARYIMERAGYSIHVYPPTVKPTSSMS